MGDAKIEKIAWAAGAPEGYGGPFLSLDIPVDESPVKTDKDLGGSPSLTLHAHPDTVHSFSQTITSTVGGAFGSIGAGLHPSVGVFAEVIFAGGVALARHENAHTYVLNRNGEGYQSRNEPVFTNTLVDIAGINANLVAANSIPLDPYEGVMSDLNEISAALDFPAYYLFQEKLNITFGGRDGDLGKTTKFLEGRGLKYTDALTAGLGVWQAVDLFWWKDAPVFRAAQYALDGKAPENPYSPGRFALKSAATLSPFGHMGGLAAFYFLDGHTRLPSAIMARFEASPVRRDDTLFPFVFEARAERVPLPVKIGPVALAVSGGLVMAGQDAGPFVDDSEMQSGILTHAYRGGLHFQAGSGEISVEARYKQKGFIPNEGYGEEFAVWTGLRAGLGD